MKTLKTLFTVFLLLFIQEEASAKYVKNTLQLIHVVFRHGDRTPDSTYPKDPYRNETYYPIGLGDLTNAGKRREYYIGLYLRDKYGPFIGDIVEPDTLVARSSEYSRTKKSLQLVLTGLFPPRRIQIWNNNLNWQPIATSYRPLHEDKVFFGVLCEENLKLRNSYKRSKSYRTTLAKYKSLILYTSEKTGIDIKDFTSLAILFYDLKSQQNYGLRLPSWTDKIFPEQLGKATVDFYKTLTASIEARKFVAGYLLKSIIEEMKEKISGKAPENRKIYLYSGHEINIAFLLITLGVFDDKPPNFGSHIIMELHKIRDEYGIRFLYQNYEGADPKVLRPYFCDEDICKFSAVLRGIGKYIPDNNECEKLSDLSSL